MIIPNSLPVLMHKEYWQTLDSTKLQCFASCPRSFFFQYVLGWKAETLDNSLVFGQAWHEALEYLYKNGLKFEELNKAVELFINTYRKKYPEETDVYYKKKSPSQGIAGLLEYLQNYPEDAYKYEVLDTEVGGLVPIAEDRQIAVKLDLIAKEKSSDSVVALEHKTSTIQGQTWGRQWALSIQIGAYLHTLNTYYNGGRIIVNGAFFYTNKREFSRIICERDAWAMANWLHLVNCLWDSIEREFEVLSNDKAEYTIMHSFPQNPTACNSFAGCPYHDLCTCVANPLRLVAEGNIPIGMEEFWWNPLEGLDKEFKNENIY